MEEQDELFEQVMSGLRGLEPAARKRAFAILRREREEALATRLEEERVLPNSHYSKAHVLQRLRNPPGGAYEQKILIPELTFVGTANQPDFGEVLLTFYPGEWTIELKSLKTYKDSFRASIVSYERLCNVMFEDLMQVYEPMRMRMMVRMRPRGGISSCLTIDSDWAIRGGDEQFKDWTTNVDRFGFDTVSAVRV